MAKGINKVILIGHLGQDPEIRYMPNGNPVATISLATTESWKDKQSGEQRSRTEWHRVSLFGGIANIAVEYLKKGAQVYIEGRLQTRKWTDQNGQDRYSTDIVVDIGGQMQMLGGARQANQHPQGGAAHPAPGTAQPLPNQMAPTGNFDDDIPFAPIGLQHPTLVWCL